MLHTLALAYAVAVLLCVALRGVQELLHIPWNAHACSEDLGTGAACL